MTRSKDIGTLAESAVVKAFIAHPSGAFTGARRMALRGNKDVGDIDTRDDRLVVEVKSGKVAETASDKLVRQWLKETEKERRNAGAHLGILVLKRKGIGHGNAGEWWSIIDGYALADLIYPDGWASEPIPLTTPAVPVRIHLDNLIGLLALAGYGTESR